MTTGPAPITGKDWQNHVEPRIMAEDLRALEQGIKQALDGGGGTGSGIELVSGTVTLDSSGTPIREFYTTGAATIGGISFAAGTAVVFRRDTAEQWGYKAVDGWIPTDTTTPPGDTTAPTGSVTASVSGATLTATATFTDTGGGEVVEYRFSLTSGGLSSAAWQPSNVWSATISASGTVYAQARDDSGNISSAVSAAFTFTVNPPSPGTLAASDPTIAGFTLTVTDASTNAEEYAFSSDGGTTYSPWQTSPTFRVTDKPADTSISCRHKVRNAATGEATGVAITATTSAITETGLLGAMQATGFAAIWAYDEQSGTVCTDHSGNRRHGTYTADRSTLTSRGISKIASIAQVPDSDIFTITDSGFTLWGCAASAAARTIIQKGMSEGVYEWRMSVLSTGEVEMAPFDPSGNPVTAGVRSTATPYSTSSQWHAIAATMDGPYSPRATLYIDGAAATTTDWGDATTGYTNGPAYVQIAGGGQISCAYVAVATRALTAEEITTLTNAARAEGLAA